MVGDQVIIGGAQSTGSSLLVNILNRHFAISAGAETYLFMHPRLYTNWSFYKKYLLRTNKLGGLKSQGWFLMNSAQLLHEDYGWDKETLKQMIQASVDFPTFASAYMSKRMQLTGADIWVEKSPANVMAFPNFLEIFPSPKLIHTTRDPYDTVASLVARGYSPYYAAGAYILHNALALRSHQHPNYYLVKYEDLVLKSRETVQGLLSFLDLPWVAGMLEPGPRELEKEVKLKGWLQNERGRIGTKSLGRFNRLSKEDQVAIIDALALFRIKPSYAKKHALHFTSLKPITKILGYYYLKNRHPDVRKLTRQMRYDQWRRAMRFYPAFGKKYPGGVAGA